MTQLIDDTEARHQALIEQLAAYVDDELSAEERAQMQAHLLGCTRCRREIALQRALRAQLARQPSTRASAALRERIAAALDTATDRPSDSVAQDWAANIVQGLRGVLERLTPRPARSVLPWIGWAFAVPLAVVGLVLVTRPESEGDHVPTGGVSAEVPVIVAAADLKFALGEVAARFTADTKHELKLVFGSSGNFAEEIEQDAPFQMFLSADEGLVFTLAEAGKTVDRGVLYAIGRIAIMVPHGSPLKPDPELRHLAAALSEGRITRFAIADPEHAPHGKRAEEALRHAGLWDRIKDHLVLGENVSQAAQLATAGGAQGGIIAYSLALSPSISKLGRYALIPDAWHQPLKQRMVLIKGANETTQAFYRYLQQPAARDILRRYGLALPGEQ
ncbi:MAG: molybdate ABC transporter substrate-binding protein [Gammaproteobacteria bacterium]